MEIMETNEYYELEYHVWNTFTNVSGKLYMSVDPATEPEHIKKQKDRDKKIDLILN